MLIAVPLLRWAHVSAVTCSRPGTSASVSVNFQAGCLNQLTPYLRGVACLAVGAIMVIIGLGMGRGPSGSERKADRQYKRDLKAGKYDPTPIAPEDDLTSVHNRLALLKAQAERADSAHISHDNRFLKPFDPSPESGEDATSEVAQADAQENGEEG
jgi:hypothetical protein